jgi:hypothetical protein
VTTTRSTAAVQTDPTPDPGSGVKRSSRAREDGQDPIGAAMDHVRRALPELPAVPHVDDLQVELGIDSNGHDVARITVVLEDDPSGEPYRGAKLQPIRDLIWDVFNARALDRWPYIRFVLKSELDEQDDEPDAAAE